MHDRHLGPLVMVLIETICLLAKADRLGYCDQEYRGWIISYKNYYRLTIIYLASLNLMDDICPYV